MSDTHTHVNDALEVGRRLVELCDQGKHREAMEELYADNCVSVEPVSMGGPARFEGKDAIRAKHDHWDANTEVTGGSTIGPFPHGDRFTVYFTMQGKCKQTGRDMDIREVALYTVAGGKIVKEEFFYDFTGYGE